MRVEGSLDANVVLRLLLDDVPEQHAVAIALLRRSNSLAIADVALIETIFVLGRAYELTRPQQAEAIVGLVRQPGITANSEHFESAFEIYLQQPKLSFEDCYLAVAAELSSAQPLWTFDKKFANQTSAELLTAEALGAV